MASEAIGTCPCRSRDCEQVAEIHVTQGKGKHKRLMLKCPDCGTLQPFGQAFQNYVRKTGTFSKEPPETSPAAAEKGKPATSKALEEKKPAAQPAAPRGGWNNWGLDDL